MPATTHRDTGFDAPADIGLAVTPDTDNDLPNGPTRGLYVGGAGNLVVVMAADQTSSGAGTAVTFTAVPAGTVLPLRARRVLATGTATAIVALY